MSKLQLKTPNYPSSVLMKDTLLKCRCVVSHLPRGENTFGKRWITHRVSNISHRTCSGQIIIQKIQILLYVRGITVTVCHKRFTQRMVGQNFSDNSESFCYRTSVSDSDNGGRTAFSKVHCSARLRRPRKYRDASGIHHDWPYKSS